MPAVEVVRLHKILHSAKLVLLGHSMDFPQVHAWQIAIHALAIPISLVVKDVLVCIYCISWKTFRTYISMVCTVAYTL